jgi:hypothetical protein
MVDFTDRPGFLMFSAPYMLLTGNPAWGQPYRVPENPPPGFGYADMLMIEGYDQRDPQAYRTPPPMTALSYRSRLIHLASSGEHHDVRVEGEDLERSLPGSIPWPRTAASRKSAKSTIPSFPASIGSRYDPGSKPPPHRPSPGPVD